jgi:hypothetical protein
VDLPVAVAILSEDVLEEHQLGLQAVFITESSSSVNRVDSTACLLDG